MSQKNDIHKSAMTTFTKTIMNEYPQAAIAVYDLNGQADNSSRLINEVISFKPNVVLAIGTNAGIMAKNQIRNIPIVFCMVLNPVSSGIVNNMDSPGGSITGASLDIPIETQFRYLKSVITDAKSLGVIYNPKETGIIINEASKIAKNMNLSFTAKPVNSEREVPDALKYLLKNVDVLWSVADSTVFGSQSTKYILMTTLKSGVPFVGLSPAFVKAGALMALSYDYPDIGKQSAEIAIRVLKGENPGLIPISVPRKIYLSINLKTSTHLGLRIPDYIIKTAYEVIK